jgi:predicted amidohydrolase YtcJ
LVIDGATLAMVGTNEDARKANAEQVIDAGGRLIVPGFTDAHVHFREGGFGLASVQLRDAATRDEFVARIKAFAATVPRARGSQVATGITACGAASCRRASGSMQ